ncbi:MAG: lactate utilization protein C [Dichotomicrobium sp.]
MARDDGRERTLGAIRAALSVRGDEAGRRGRVRARLEQPEAGPIPQRARGKGEELAERFSAMLRTQNAGVVALAEPSELPEAVSDVLMGRNLPQRVRTGADDLFAALDWNGQATLERVTGPAQADDCATLSHALAGAAETGTLFLASGADNPSTLNFLPELHMIAIRREDIVGSYEKAWSRFRAAYGRRKLPRTVNLISAASRTADIEQTLIKGAHGPKDLVVFIIG